MASVERVAVALCGAGGYGSDYLRAMVPGLLDGPLGCASLFGGPEIDARPDVVAVVEPFPAACGQAAVLEGCGIPVFAHLEEALAAARVDLVVIVSPIHAHVEQAVTALAHGAHVLVDKPLAAVIQDADRVVLAHAASGRDCRVGYQWSFSPAIQSLKRDLRAGRFGRPLSARALCAWPRDDRYYRRNTWAGRLQTADGAWVLDSPAMNAMAHFLHNLLYVLGPDADTSARPLSVVAEVYRANPIENADTVLCRVATEEVPDVLFLASHTSARAIAPRFRIVCEEAVVSCGERSPEIVVSTARGIVETYAAPDASNQFAKLVEAVSAVRTQTPVLCGPLAARAQCLVVNGAQDSAGSPVPLQEPVRHREESSARWIVPGLDEVLNEAYEQARLPTELGVGWAVAGSPIDLTEYRWYPGGIRPVPA